MATQPILYGAFNLNDGVTYILQEKPMSTVKINQSLVNVARLEGVKKSGAYVGERNMTFTVAVVGKSRADLESKLDILYAALNTPQQHIQMHTGDTRYFIGDATYAEVGFKPGNVINALVKISFICQQPYAFAASSSAFSTGNITYTQTGSNWNYGFSVTGGGNVFARPTITLTNETTGMATVLTTGLTMGNTYTSINVSAIASALRVGDVLVLAQLNHSSPIAYPTTQSIVVATAASIGATTIAVNSFIASISWPNNAGGFFSYYTNVALATGWTSVAIQQTTDNQFIGITNPAANPLGLASSNGATLTIVCNPVTGFSVLDSYLSPLLQAQGYSPQLLFQGRPPSLNYLATPFAISIVPLSSNEPVIVNTMVAWNARWLS